MSDTIEGAAPTAPTTFNMADIWEAIVELCASRPAVSCGDRHLTFADLEARANRLAHAMADRGVGPGDHVGLYLQNGTEYLEGMLAAYKLRAVPINVNFRYVADELRYLFDDADLVGVIHHRAFIPQLAAIAGDLPKLGWKLSVDDGSDAALDEIGAEDYETVLAAASPARDFGPRSNDDPYVIYTGGTTGMPKGVVWRQEDAYFACVGGGDPMRLFGPVTDPSQIPERIVESFVALPLAPLMHAAAQWTSLSWLLAGGRLVLMPGSLDPVGVWRTVEAEKVNLLVIVGDAVARPLLDAWDEAGPFDVSSLFSVGSGGAPLTPRYRERLVELLPHAAVVDGFGSSETGAQGSKRLAPGDDEGGPTRFQPYGDTTVVLDLETLEPVAPGSGVVGRVALRGRIPQAYYKDPDKTAATFVEAGGHRWVLTGDEALVHDDGTIELRGRGSVCINTGGEKVYPEEVEAVLKSHDDVYDAVVVGIPDERWGQAVAAVIAASPGTAPDGGELAEHCRSQLAGYKVPKSILVVPRVERSPAGKADYRWAREIAEAGAAIGGGA